MSTNKRSPTSQALSGLNAPKRRCHGNTLSFPFGGSLLAQSAGPSCSSTNIGGVQVDMEDTGPHRRGAIDYGLGLGQSEPALLSLPSSFASSSFVFGTPLLPTPSPLRKLSVEPSTSGTSPATCTTTSLPVDNQGMEMEVEPFDIEEGSPRWPTIPLLPCDVAEWAALLPGIEALEGFGAIDLNSPSPSPSPSPSQAPQSSEGQSRTPGAPPPWPLPALPSALSISMSTLSLTSEDDAVTTASLDSESEAALWEAASLLLVPRTRRRAMSAPLRPMGWASDGRRGWEGVVEE